MVTLRHRDLFVNRGQEGSEVVVVHESIGGECTLRQPRESMDKLLLRIPPKRVEVAGRPRQPIGSDPTNTVDAKQHQGESCF